MNDDILVIVAGGLIQEVVFPDNCPDVRVIVHDYDVEGSNEADLEEDQEGNNYIEGVWA